MLLNPYLNFRGQAEEVLGFYQGVFGGDLNLMRFADLGGMGMPAADQQQIMHGQLTAPIGTIMAADVPASMDLATSATSISLSGGPDEDKTLRGYWDGLTDGATVTAPINLAPWGDTFGMLTDRFGISWLVNIGGQQG